MYDNHICFIIRSYFSNAWKVDSTESSVWEDDIRLLQDMPEVVYIKYEDCTWQFASRELPRSAYAR